MLGISDRWQVWAGAGLYLVFFVQGTGLRTVRHGEFADRKKDRQVKSAGGKLAAFLTAPGLLLAHWISLYTFSRIGVLNVGLTPSTIAGIGLALLGMTLNFQSTRTLGRFFDRLAIKEGHELVTHGVYGWVRHPIYTSYLCLFFSFPLLTESALGAIAIGVVCAIWFGNRIPTEEAMLEEAFGEDYRAYKARTKRLIPFVL